MGFDGAVGARWTQGVSRSIGAMWTWGLEMRDRSLRGWRMSRLRRFGPIAGHGKSGSLIAAETPGVEHPGTHCGSGSSYFIGHPDGTYSEDSLFSTAPLWGDRPT